MAALRVGILGAGFMGQTHAQRLMTQRGVKVDSICSLPLASAEALSRDVCGGKAACYDDFDVMLRERDLDALYVCIPPFAHNGQVEKAARKGVHIFMEKPVALTPKRAASMTRAIESAGVVSQVGYHMRHAPAVRQLRKMIDDGSAGRPTLFQARYFCNALHHDWWRDPQCGGGQVLEQAIHIYDMAIHLLGTPRTVAGFADNLCHQSVGDYKVEDTSAAIIRFDSGAMASIVASNCAVPTEWTGDFRVVCENVTADFSASLGAEFAFSEGTPAETYFESGKKVRRTSSAREADCYLEETRNFLAAVRGKADACAPARDGLLGVKLVSAMLKSARNNGRAVAIR
jgi:myo-inositol 2-dehydrogenase / D-chiro-inositol 1-dehydrogenase